MKYYLDITLLPDAEANLGFLWHKVYHQIHIGLVDNGFLSDELVKARNGKQEPLKKSHIALSFPNYKIKDEFPLGNILRLFAETKEQLEALNVKELLNRFTDYTHCKLIQQVDETKVKKHVCFKRKQFKSPSRITKDLERRVKYLVENKPEKYGDNILQVKTKLQELAKKYDDRLTLPFINLMSFSSKPDASLPDKDRFLLFIEMQGMDTEIKGDFTCYGLSRRNIKDRLEIQATVPWF
ncbi:type I-F CRISPR-associated endoribonuclease Cas6/Csy4 [Colwellia sp. 39_35_sub15_T18]|nr:type I-F CRISPR-associated endoribonuclease Cas6/Csy4 [Colwellia sp. 39_35_sub15_T18]